MKTALFLTLILVLSSCASPKEQEAPKTTPEPKDGQTTTVETKNTDTGGLPVVKTPGSGESLISLKNIGDISRGLSRPQLIKVIRAAMPGLRRCSMRHKAISRFRLRVTVSGEGKVTALSLGKVTGTPLEKCVRAVYSRMIFPLFTGPAVTFTYVFRSPKRSASGKGGSGLGGKGSGGSGLGGGDSTDDRDEDTEAPDKPSDVNTGHKHDDQGSEDL
ncbi:hypothetical protein KKF84_00550 [Myxococcota bacterium]|nr:hypothetical protein [Myxococcota bacterium]MBU1533774.1 hypothetical protein [Myxococcota bacterium]